jgi:ABC-2 type transport system permease protein
MNTTFPMLIRREFWEHKSLWIAPLIWVGLITLFFTWGVIQGPDGVGSGIMNAQSMDQTGLNAQDRQELQNAIQIPDDRKQALFAGSFLAIFGLVSAFMTIVVFFYLIDCLYTERKDRSILFWKSLPVSDSQVVLSKLAVGVIVVPLGVIALSAALQLLLYAIVWLRLHGTIIGEIMPDWSFMAWLHSQAIALGLTLGGVLWYAPIAAYLLLLSTWAKNKVFLWAVLPPIALSVLEKVFQGSSHVAEFLAHRFSGFITEMRLNPRAFETGDHGTLPRVSDVYDAFPWWNVFASTEMWLGVAAAAVMLFVAIRLRRYRDES